MKPSPSPLFCSLFEYKAWADRELFDQLEMLEAPERAAAREAALRIASHFHVVDRIFAAHLAGRPHGYEATNTPETPPLGVLRAAVEEQDRWYVDYVGTLAPELLPERLPFTFTDGADGCLSREEMLAHVATHALYHRGAIGRVLLQASVPPPRDGFAAFLHATEPVRRERR